MPLFDAQDIVVKVRSGIKVVEVIVAFGCDNKYAVVIIELAEISALLIVIDAQHIGIKPHFASAQCRVTFLLEGD